MEKGQNNDKTQAPTPNPVAQAFQGIPPQAFSVFHTSGSEGVKTVKNSGLESVPWTALAV